MVKFTNHCTLTIDLGTHACKVSLFDEKGSILAQTHASFPISYPKPTWAEVNPEDWWGATVCSIRRILKTSNVLPSQIKMIGICGLMHSPVLVDKQGKPVDTVMLWMDQRCIPQTKWLAGKYDRKIQKICGTLPTFSYSAPKLQWLVENRPEIIEKTYKILFPKDYIRFKLTGCFCTEISDCLGSLLFDVTKKNWSKWLLALIGLPPEKMPEIYNSSQIVGEISKKAAEETGLKRGTPVIAGGSDVYCTLIGTNAYLSNWFCLYLGTSAWIAAFSSQDRMTSTSIEWIGSTATTGAILEWYKRTWGDHFKSQSTAGLEDVAYYIFNKKAKRAPLGAAGIIFLPHLMGERGPISEPHARGVIYGLTLAHREEHIIRALFEGTAYSIRALIENSDKKISRMLVAGGGAKSRIWTQIIANVTGKPLLIPTIVEAGSLGAFMLASVRNGLFPDISKAASKLVQIRRIVSPVDTLFDKYSKIYHIYEKLNDCLFKNNKFCEELEMS